MKIVFPGISQEDFDGALSALEACKITTPLNGFIYPFFGPGGLYGNNWWNIDSCVALVGYKWFDQKFAEDGIRNFIAAQNPDGRIKLWGNDKVPKYDEDISSLPKLFEVAYNVIKRSEDEQLIKSTYIALKKYLDWWLTERLDKCGLVTAVFEETFPPYLYKSGVRAAVDTNIEIMLGCKYVEKLSEYFGDYNAAQKYCKIRQDIALAMNKFMWDEKTGAYYPYFVKENKREDFLIASTFMPLRLGVADGVKKTRLLTLLTDNKHFNWDSFAVTSASKLDKQFTTTAGDYQFNASWSGSVWTLLNEAIIQGLKEVGEFTKAAKLCLTTALEFNNNYAELLNPFDGSGQGVLKYAWTASQYLQIIIEEIFGVDYDNFTNTITIAPKIDERLYGNKISLMNIILPNGASLDVTIDCGKNSQVEYNITGKNALQVKIVHSDGGY